MIKTYCRAESICHRTGVYRVRWSWFRWRWISEEQVRFRVYYALRDNRVRSYERTGWVRA